MRARLPATLEMLRLGGLVIGAVTAVCVVLSAASGDGLGLLPYVATAVAGVMVLAGLVVDLVLNTPN